MLFRRPRPAKFVILVLLCLLAGCGKKPHLVPVAGKVIYRNKPVPSVVVQFITNSEKGTRAPLALGFTGPDGSFVLKSQRHGPGAVPGHYKVLVEGDDEAFPVKIPRKYAFLTITPLEIEVPETGLPALVLELE